MKPKTILIVLSVVALVALIGVYSVSHFVSTFSGMMYPKASPMPAVVSQSMAEILAQLDGELKTNAPQVLANLRPGLSMDKINELEKLAGIQMPDDLKAVYQWHDGFDPAAIQRIGFNSAGPMPGHDFMPLEEALGESSSLSNSLAGATPVQRAAFNTLVGFTKSWFPIFDDGSSGGYFYDPKRKPEEGAVFYHFNEDTAYIFFPSTKNLFAGIVKCYQQKVYTWKEGTNGASLDEDFVASEKVWNQYGATSN